jgi:predicted SAM-dependent methyltransferase
MLEYRPKFSQPPLLPIRPEWRERNPPDGPAATLFRRHLANVTTILDVGAGDRYWEDVLRRMGLDLTYQSVDPETRHTHDFTNFLEMEGEFDCIMMLELLEHLPLEIGWEFAFHAYDLLSPGGVLVLSTPNPRHAHQMWSSDFTHTRPWPAHDLWALCRIMGFADVDIYRQVLVARGRRPILPFKVALSRLLDLDPAYGLLLFARKGSAAGGAE